MTNKQRKAEIELLTKWNFTDQTISKLVGLKTPAEVRRIRGK